jgi:hypothetical protein
VRQSVENPKSFGISVGLVCGVIAALQWWRGRETSFIVFGALGIFLVGAALTAPAILTGPSRVWWRIARALAWFNTRLLLSILFFLVFTPVAAILRLAGRDSLQRRRRDRGSSGWVPYPERVRQRRHYERMF